MKEYTRKPKPNPNHYPFFCFICGEYHPDLEHHKHTQKEEEEWENSGYIKHSPPPKELKKED
jgi:hypothetical protein